MSKQIVDKPLEQYLMDKRNELIWALSSQDYTQAQIGRIFNLDRSTIKQIINKKPVNWVTPWFKIASIK
jgi:hypothetical protein